MSGQQRPEIDLGERVGAEIVATSTAAPLGVHGGAEAAIFGCMLSAQRLIGAVQKKQRNAHHNYNFRGIEDVLNSLHPVLNEAGVFLATEVLESSIRAIRPAAKVGWYAHVRVAYHFVAADGSSVTAIVTSGAIDYDDKATQQAMSQAYKTAMIQTFSIPTEMDDPDSRSPVSQDVAATPPPAQANSQPAPTAQANGGAPQLGPTQTRLRDKIRALSPNHAEDLKRWWVSNGLPGDDDGPAVHLLTREQVDAALDKVEEVADVPF